MRALVIGANGVIGSAVYRAFEHAGYSCTGLTTQTTPPFVTVAYNFAALDEFTKHADVIVYAIGISKFAECENAPEKAVHLNVDLPHTILRNLSWQQTFIYLSSPIALYNFQGTKPYAYAVQKQRAEALISASCHERRLIIRPSKIIESMTPLRDWKQNLATGQRITPFADQAIAPISAHLLAQQIIQLLKEAPSGDYNFSARDAVTYLECAEKVCEYFGYDSKLISPKSARASNPYFFQQDVLDCTAAQKAIGFQPPAARDIIFDYISKLA